MDGEFVSDDFPLSSSRGRRVPICHGATFAKITDWPSEQKMETFLAVRAEFQIRLHWSNDKTKIRRLDSGHYFVFGLSSFEAKRLSSEVRSAFERTKEERRRKIRNLLRLFWRQFSLRRRTNKEKASVALWWPDRSLCTRRKSVRKLGNVLAERAKITCQK